MALHGFSEVSFQMIADELGISQSTVLHHFPNKLLLIRSVLAQVIDSNHQHVSGMIQLKDSALNRLWKHLEGNRQWAQENPEQASVVLLIYYMGSVNPEFSAIYRTMLSRGRERVFELVLAAQREKSILPTLPAELLAETIHDILLASLLNVSATRSARTETRRLHAKWKSVLESLLVPQGGAQWLKAGGGVP